METLEPMIPPMSPIVSKVSCMALAAKMMMIDTINTTDECPSEKKRPTASGFRRALEGSSTGDGASPPAPQTPPSLAPLAPPSRSTSDHHGIPAAGFMLLESIAVVVVVGAGSYCCCCWCSSTMTVSCWSLLVVGVMAGVVVGVVVVVVVVVVEVVVGRAAVLGTGGSGADPVLALVLDLSCSYSTSLRVTLSMAAI